MGFWISAGSSIDMCTRGGVPWQQKMLFALEPGSQNKFFSEYLKLGKIGKPGNFNCGCSTGRLQEDK